ncbi:hypothetical protein FOZ63_029228, partial [Perkinsus olseni]
SEKERRARVMYISHVEVREDWQNRTVGTTMLRQALKDALFIYAASAAILCISRACLVEASTKFNSANLGASEDLEKFLGSLKPKKPSAKYAAANRSKVLRVLESHMAI